MAKQKAVFIRYDKAVGPSKQHPAGFLEGSTYEVKSATVAKKSHPDATIVSYVDGTPYEEPKKTTKTRKTRKKASGASGSSQTGGTANQGSTDADDTSGDSGAS